MDNFTEIEALCSGHQNLGFWSTNVVLSSPQKIETKTKRKRVKEGVRRREGNEEMGDGGMVLNLWEGLVINLHTYINTHTHTHTHIYIYISCKRV